MIDTGLDENFRKNLEHIQREVDPEEANLDWPIVLEGKEGSGKSGLAQAIALEIEGKDFEPEKQIAFSGQEFEEKAKELDPGKVIIYDEGVDDLMASDTMTSSARARVKFLRKCRELNLIIIICFPVFMEMNKKIRKNRIKNLGKCIMERRGSSRNYYALFWNQTQLNTSDLTTDKDPEEVQYPDPALSVTWNDPEKAWPEIWAEYKELKEGDIRQDQEEDQEMDTNQIINLVKKRKEDYMDLNNKEQPYIAQELIETDFDVGGRKSRKIKKAVERDLGWRRIDRADST